MTKPYQLLVANQSLTGLRSRPRQFKKVEPGFLPVFGKKSFAPPSDPSSATHYGTTIPTPSASASQCELPLFGAVAVGESGAYELRAAPEPEPPASQEMAPCEKLLASDRPERFAWVRRRWPRRFLWWGAKSDDLDSGVVQGEFGLTTVRVVRNDLVDADIEVVRAAQGSGRSTPRPAGSFLGRWWPRWFRRAMVARKE